VARKGAEPRARSRTMTAHELGPTARLGINPIEGVLGRVYGSLKQAAILRVLARRRGRARATSQGEARGRSWRRQEIGAPA
jgi:hypothetical protein